MKQPILPRIGVVTPASAMKTENVEAGQEYLRSRGFSVKWLGSNMAPIGNFAGSDESRAEQLMRAFEDDSIDAILCGRGGYGTARLEPYLDIGVIRKSKKKLFGYSDVTHLLHYLYCNGVRNLFHGPMLVDFATKKDADTFQYFERALVGDALSIDVVPQRFGAKVVRPGSAKGRIIGGNLSVLAATLATGSQIKPSNDILFIEDVGEYLFRYDRCLNQLKRAGYFDSVSAVIFGAITAQDVDTPNSVGCTWEQLVTQYVPSHVPYVVNFPCGHGQVQLSLPFGEEVICEFGDLVTIREIRTEAGM